MLQLYYTGGSPPSRAVLHTIRVLGLEVEVKNVDLLKGENKTEEFLKVRGDNKSQTYHKSFITTPPVSSIQSTRFQFLSTVTLCLRRAGLLWCILWILASLVAALGTRRMQNSEQSSIRECSLMQYRSSSLQLRLWWVHKQSTGDQKIFNSFSPSQRPIFFFGSTDVPSDKIAKLKETLRIFESFLEGNLYMTGSCPTILDLSVLSSYMMLKSTFRDYGELPNMSAWFERMKKLPGFEENETASKGILALMTAKQLSPVSMK